MSWRLLILMSVCTFIPAGIGSAILGAEVWSAHWWFMTVAQVAVFTLVALNGVIREERP